MNPETHGRARARSEAAQTYHAMLAALHEKSRTFSFAQPRVDASFPFRDNLCREVALLACRELNPEDTKLVFEFLGLTPFIHVDLEGCDCRTLAHSPECPHHWSASK